MDNYNILKITNDVSLSFTVISRSHKFVAYSKCQIGEDRVDGIIEAKDPLDFEMIFNNINFCIEQIVIDGMAVLYKKSEIEIIQKLATYYITGSLPEK